MDLGEWQARQKPRVTNRQLADRTRDLDPEGKGVSLRSIDRARSGEGLVLKAAYLISVATGHEVTPIELLPRAYREQVGERWAGCAWT